MEILNTKPMYQRNNIIDILKVIALLLIILAHVNPPSIIFELRNFDVVLMFVVSGMAMREASDRRRLTYYKYVKKRFLRLIVGTWKFLFCFFLFFFLVGIAFHSIKFSLKTVLASFLFYGGIGYVWVMRVFFQTSLLEPMYYKVITYIKSKILILLLLLAIYVLYHLSLLFITTRASNQTGFINYLLFEMIGFGIVVFVGYLMKSLNRKEKIFSTLICFFVFLFTFFTQNNMSIQFFKYPPRIQYIVYGLLISFVLINGFEMLDIDKLIHKRLMDIIVFISENTFSIYFWHVFFIYFLNYISFFGNGNYIFDYIILVSSSMLCSFVQEWLVNHKIYRINTFIKR